MATVRKIVKVFLGSPGDLGPERQAAKDVVDSFNKEWADHLGIHVELVGWEDTVTRFGRAQDLINRDLDQCELFIGMMWKAWGSPPSKTGPYTSGFEEEFDRSVKSRKKDGKPEISLFFKKIDPEFLKDQGEGLKKVLAFKKEIIDGKETLFQEFADLREFEEKFRRCITNYVQGLKNEEADKLSQESRAPSGDGSKKPSDPSKSLIGPEGTQFLKDFIAKTEGDLSENPILPVEVARFRLASSIVNAGGNDEGELGVHDANILFRQRKNLDFGRREIDGLVDAGLNYYAHQNAPLWHWYAVGDAETRGLLSIRAAVGSLDEKIGAIGAMRLISEPLAMKPMIAGGAIDLTRDFYLDSWFAPEADDRLKAAALTYLGTCGTKEDLPTIKKEFARGNYQTLGPATDAIIRIELRDSRSAAIDALNELQPESVDESLLAELFEKPDGIDTARLQACAAHRSPKVRKVAVPLLVHRNELPVETAEKLLADPEAKVRFYALRALSKAGREFNDERAKAVLVKPRRGAGLFAAPIAPDSEGEEYFERFRTERLRSLSDAALQAEIASDSIFDRNAQFAQDYKHFADRSAGLRKAVADEFKQDFAKELEKLKESYSPENETYKKIVDLESFLRQGFTKQGLSILCEKGDAKDLQTVRTALALKFVDPAPSHFDFMKRHGEWKDIPLIISMAERPGSRSSLLWGYDADKLEPLATTVLGLGKGRLAEILDMQMPDRLRSLIVLRATDAEISKLTDDQILPLLNSSNDQVRRVTALRVIKRFTKKRVSTLLKKYTEHSDHRYYNVIHWLDLGVSLSKDRVTAAANRALEKDEP